MSQNDALHSRLMAYCQMLTDQSRYQESEGFHYWPPEVGAGERDQCGVCTNGAILVARQFYGQVFGYKLPPESDPRLVGCDCFGHDFALVDEYLIDWWGWDYENSISRPVLHLKPDVELIRNKYKPRKEWELMYDYRGSNKRILSEL